MLYAAAQTRAGGRWSGLMAALGLHLGGYLHVAAAAAGLSVLFHAVPVLYTAVKLGGALYLIWLGIAMFRAKTPGSADLTAFEPKSGWRALIESITVKALNPKTAIFFLAFLPQFIAPAASLPAWGAVPDSGRSGQHDVFLCRSGGGVFGGRGGGAAAKVRPRPTAAAADGRRADSGAGGQSGVAARMTPKFLRRNLPRGPGVATDLATG